MNYLLQKQKQLLSYVTTNNWDSAIMAGVGLATREENQGLAAAVISSLLPDIDPVTVLEGSALVALLGGGMQTMKTNYSLLREAGHSKGVSFLEAGFSAIAFRTGRNAFLFLAGYEPNTFATASALGVAGAVEYGRFAVEDEYKKKARSFKDAFIDEILNSNLPSQRKNYANTTLTEPVGEYDE